MYDEPTFLTTYCVLNLQGRNFEIGQVFKSKHKNRRYIQIKDDGLIFCQKNKKKCYVIDVKWDHAVGYAWYSHMEEIMALVDTPKQITFDPILKDITLYPSMIRLTHIYTCREATDALKQAFKKGMALYYTETDVNEMILAN